MKQLKKILNNEVFLYLVFGVATTLVYMATRAILFSFIPSIEIVVFLANATAILFAFVTNDSIVFKQKRVGWPKRLLKFLSARLITLIIDVALAVFLVRLYPGLIGQFVGHEPEKINLVATLIAQVVIVVANYILSKLFVFKEKKPQ